MSKHTDRLEAIIKRAGDIDPLAGEILRKAADQVRAEEVARQCLVEEYDLEGAFRKAARGEVQSGGRGAAHLFPTRIHPETAALLKERGIEKRAAVAKSRRERTENADLPEVVADGNRIELTDRIRKRAKIQED